MGVAIASDKAARVDILCEESIRNEQAKEGAMGNVGERIRCKSKLVDDVMEEWNTAGEMFIIDRRNRNIRRRIFRSTAARRRL
jgi:hypothetical protein